MVDDVAVERALSAAGRGARVLRPEGALGRDRTVSLGGRGDDGATVTRIGSKCHDRLKEQPAKTIGRFRSK